MIHFLGYFIGFSLQTLSSTCQRHTLYFIVDLIRLNLLNLKLIKQQLNIFVIIDCFIILQFYIHSNQNKILLSQNDQYRHWVDWRSLICSLSSSADKWHSNRFSHLLSHIWHLFIRCASKWSWFELKKLTSLLFDQIDRSSRLSWLIHAKNQTFSWMNENLWIGISSID